MVILLDGQQAVGKSTLSRKLSRYFMSEMKNLPVHCVHYEGSKVDTAEYNKKQYCDMFRLFVEGFKTRHFVVDRPHIGEIVWSKLYKNYDAETFIYDLERDFILEHPVVNAKVLQFFLFDEVDCILAREKARKGDSYSYTVDDREKLLETQNLYIDAAFKTSLNTRIVWLEGRAVDEVFEEMVKEIRRFA
jgi:thymidylate kinase